MAPRSSNPPRASNTPANGGVRWSFSSIVAMVGKGMAAAEILQVFPELGLDDIRSALLRAADVVCDSDASLVTDPVGEIIRAAQRSSNLSEAEAMDLAVAETRAARSEPTTSS
jgi:uncharacterized protein (DUF433 family)